METGYFHAFVQKRKSAESFFILLLALSHLSHSQKATFRRFEFIQKNNRYKTDSFRVHLHGWGGFFLFEQFLEQIIIRRHAIPVAGAFGRLYRLSQRRGNQVNILTAFASGLFTSIFISDPVFMATLRALESNHFFLPFSLKEPSSVFFSSSL